MLDAAAYRASEATAKRAIASWRLANVNDPYVFQNQGFPVRTESFLDLAQILDTMQEERFDFYMGELGGFTDEETGEFVDVCLDYIDFYLRVFQRGRVVIPLSTMIAHFVIYKKLCGYRPQFRRLLELGPGCGYLSFFLRRHGWLEDYSQVESTESFYLLQSHINTHIFGSNFAEHAISQQAFDDHNVYIPKLEWHNPFHYEQQKIININKAAVCNHYPWWRLGDVAAKRYDIVTSNANLNEFSREALFQYLSLIRDVLADDGAIVAQCLGGGPPSYDSIFANMKRAGFVPVALVTGADTLGRIFVVSNAVFVGEKHPLYDRYVDATPQFPTLDRGHDFVNRMYFINEERKGERRIRSASDILDMILDRIESAPGHWNGGASQRQFGGDDGASEERSGAEFAAADGSGKALQKVSTSASQADRERLRMLAKIESLERALDGKVPASSNRLEIDRLRLAAELEAARHQLSEIRRSTSWRITAPMRSAVDAAARCGLNRSIRAKARSLVRDRKS